MLDPSHCYVVRSANLEDASLDGPMKRRVRAEYSPTAEGYAIPISHLEESEWRDAAGKPQHTTYEAHCTLREAPPAPDAAEFTLAAFGFPEPFAQAAKTNWLLWCAVAGIVLIALAYVLRRIATRRPAGAN